MDIEELKQPLDVKNIKTRNQGGATLFYIEGWHAISEANRIFGFDGWQRETVFLEENCAPTQNKKGNYVVSFRAKVRINVIANGGVTSRDGVGFGSGISADIHQAYESAVKEAETDAMKRALMTFGNQFGLALYDKEQRNVEDVEQKEKQAEHNQDVIERAENALSQINNPEGISDWINEKIDFISKQPPEVQEAINKYALKRHEELSVNEG